MENFVLDRQESVGRDIYRVYLISSSEIEVWNLKVKVTRLWKENMRLSRAKKQKPHPKPQKVVFRMQEIRARTREKDVASQIKLTQSVG